MFNDNLIALISFGFLWIRGLFLTRFLYFYWFLVNLFGNGFLWDSGGVFAFLKLFKHFLYVFFYMLLFFLHVILFFLHVIFFLLHVFIPPQKGNRKGRHFFYTYSQKGRATRKNTCTSIRGAKKNIYVFVPAPTKLSELAQQEFVKQIYMVAYRLRGHAGGAGCKNTCFHTTSVGIGLRPPKHIKKPSR